MFQSVSGHSSEQSISRYSSRPTLSQLKVVSDTISNWFENHQPQRTQISTVTNAPFIQNSNRMASRLTTTASFPNVFFNSSNFQSNFQAFRLKGLLWWQKLTRLFQYFPQDLWILQFNSAFAVSFHSTRSDFRVTFDSGVIFLDQSQFLLRIATNEIAAICIDNRWRQMAFFRVRQSGQGRWQGPTFG